MIRNLQLSSHFRRDIKTIRKKHLPIQNIQTTVHLIIVENYDTLRKSYDDHALSGNLQGYRDLHVKGFNNLIIIYQVIQSKSLLKLARVGTHDQLLS